MKTDLKIGLGIFAAYCVWALHRARKAKGTSGIGAVKRAPRRIWKEVEEAQKAGIDLTDPNGWEQHTQVLKRLSRGKLSNSASSKPDEQRYFNQLRRAYKSIAGTTMAHDQSVVRNEYGDVILIYNDYHLDQLPKTAADWIEDFLPMDSAEYGYWHTIADIARMRVSFVWNSKGEHRGVEQLIFGHNTPSERKQRISYLASPGKGGVYPEAYAHKLWEDTDRTKDDQDILNGVLDAIRDTPSVGAAQKACIDEYLKAHQAEEPLLHEDIPF